VSYVCAKFCSRTPAGFCCTFVDAEEQEEDDDEKTTCAIPIQVACMMLETNFIKQVFVL